ncbi:Xaa-Pro dipeptidase [Alkalibacterium putridalgicola]|uniref:Dipeptidase n=1 Tax=Alkalibacterium putridalgicola TaxID=426703 RepID=A0A1H7SHP8_9LACT|nr:Xaa-Pro peptidase family protein [Alkalibacterium putridalgicola]GEK88740.1 dipeptidase [Alkalibacterium putridalgicola]SEL72033.1 Xaa-Pro dipeptidase [Alkalibacterium putridalgicola]
MTLIKKLQQTMRDKKLDMLYFDEPLTVAYLTGFESEPHERVVAVLVFSDKVWMIVPELEKQSAKAAATCDRILSYKDEVSPWSLLKDALKGETNKTRHVGVDEESLVVSRYHELKDVFSTASFVNSTSLIQNLRVIKQSYEIDIMKEAGQLADKALEIGMSSLKNGITEAEVVALIEYEIKKYGVEKMSFPTMVLFGDHAASPHGNPGSRKLQPNEWVLFDLGVVYKGYTSDMTRTVVYGQADKKTQEIYNVVKDAQENAQNFIKPGVRAGDIDKAARQHIEDAGYGEYFSHRLGHGLGKSVHEYPNIAPGVALEIEENMCFSIEPGIYIEDYYGVRIEDCVYVTESGALPLTHTPKEMIELPIKE